MDNTCGQRLDPGDGGRFDSSVTNFGEQLKALRLERGLTREELAAAIGVSQQTIYRGESAAACSWRRSTVVDALVALDRRAPVPDARAKAYLKAAGVSEELLETARRTAALAIPDNHHTTDPLERIAMDLVRQLIAGAGAERVITAVQSLAAGWAVKLESPVPPTRPRALVYETIQDAHRVREYVPITETPQKPPSKPRASKLG